ncbi:hypothetical protein CYY_004341 [Polysphondylium violaceum]|uniref:Sjogrens syndrome scleroderma autoantigen 1 family protein n=1 Tax=Polysphondylium violaceum TaxID=133409 RepID=A0A8J4Q5K8_9MYCE|nr:hypothetical protein CYY_004341 [Polysphondylium violaceum]
MADASMLLGKKLLQGWAMLDSVCQLCSVVPLMEDRKNKVITCVTCNQFYTRDNNNKIIILPSDQQNSIKINDNEVNISVSEPPVSTTSSSTSTSSPSSSLNDKHQQKLKEDEYMLDKDYYFYSDEDEDEEYVPLTEEEKQFLDKKMKKSEEFSSKMGQHLLKGWALLGDVCPNKECFGVPLMKDREKNFVCVSCESSGLTIDDLVKPTTKQQTPLPTVEKLQINSNSNSNSSSHNGDINTNNNNNTKYLTPSKNQITDSTLTSFSPPYPEPDHKRLRKEISPSVNNNFSQTKPTTIFTQGSSSVLSEEISDLPDVTNSTIKVLLERMKQTNITLESCQDQNEIPGLCALIREYSETMSSLLSLKKNWL